MPDHLQWIWRAWHRLTLDRPWWPGGMGPAVPGRIPWGLVQDWATGHALTFDATLFLDRCLIAMDTVFLEYWTERAKAQAAAVAAGRRR